MKNILFVAFLLAVHYNLNAQISFGNYLHDGIYTFDDDLKVMKNELFTTYKSQFNLSTDDEMVFDKEENVTTDIDVDIKTTVTYSRYKQYYKDYPVEYHSMTVVGKCEVVLMANGNVVTGLDIDVTHPVAESTALSHALDYVNAPLGYSWQDPNYELMLISRTEDDSTGIADSSKTAFPTGELVIAKKYGDEYEDIAENYAFCWRFEIGYFDTITHDSLIVDSSWVYNVHDTIEHTITVYVDANTGDVWSAYEQNQGYWWEYGAVQTWYHGNRTDILTRNCTICTNYSLVDYRDIITYDGDKAKHHFKGSNNAWVASAEKEPASAYWALQRAYDFYEFKHLRTYNNKLNCFVNSKDANGWGARFNMGQGEGRIQVQPGFGNTSQTSLDVMGHEFTHGIIYESSQLGWGFPKTEANALNEGFADIMGLAVERYVNGWTDWDFGDDGDFGIFKRRFNDPYNDIHPNYSGTSSASYSDVAWNASNSDYVRSGPLRRWFNHLSQGEWNWIPAFSGVGFDLAERIAFLTMINLHATSDYSNARATSLQIAAENYGGYCSPTWKKVERAWYDVGVGSLTQCRPFGLLTGKVIDIGTISSEATRPAKLKVKSNFEDVDNIEATAFTWILPSNWNGSYSTDNSVFTLTDVDNDFSSKEVTVIVSYLVDTVSKSDTLKTYVHFSNSCEGSIEEKNSNQLQPVPLVKEIKAEDVTVFPNPTSKYLNVIIPNNISSANLNLTDLSGKTIYGTPLHNGYNSILLPKVSSGIYLLKISNDRMNIVKRIIIND